jgi:uncharacterized protein
MDEVNIGSHAPESSEQASRLTGFHVMAKPAGPTCNLGCKYCFYLEKEQLYPKNSNWRMSDEVLETYVRQYIEAQNAPIITFAWQGGEPTLLGVDYFRKIVALQKKYANGKRTDNALQTNGVLLDDEWGEFLAENKFLVGLSIDGPRELHDRYRVDKGGQPTFDKVTRGLGYLKKHQVEFNTLTVVQRHNSYHPLEVYRFLKEIGSRFMQFIPIVERIADTNASGGTTFAVPGVSESARVSSWSVEPLQYGRFLNSIFDAWVRSDVGCYFVQMFDIALESWLGMEPGLCVFRKTCGDATVIEHNGDLYSCDHYVYPQNKLGNVLEDPLSVLVSSHQQQQFGRNKYDSMPRYCMECNVRFACNGECPKHRFLRTPDGEYGLNYLCAGYKLFFKHIDTYMRYMAEELRQGRPAANVMDWIRRRDGGESDGRLPGRNDPCPCGSGRKHKKCCAN